MSQARPFAFAALMLASSFASLSFAQERDSAEDPSKKEEDARALPCRPTIACMAEIVPKNTLEIEAGYAQRIASDARLQSAQVLLKYSLSDHFQLQLGTNNLIAAQDSARTQSFDGVYGGPKLLLADQGDWSPSFAVSALFMGPTRQGEDALQQQWDGYFWAYISKDLAGFHGDINFGFNVLGLDKKPEPQVLTALAISRDLFGGLGSYVELYGFHGGAPYAEHDAGVLAGLSYAPIQELIFDAGADTALYRDTRSVTVFAGATFLPYDMVRNHLPQHHAERLAASREH
jgi:hypothetical protein